MNVEIKPLKWKRDADGNWRATTAVGDFVVWSDEHAISTEPKTVKWLKKAKEYWVAQYPNARAAKRAASEAYTAAIMGCLEEVE